LTLYFTNKVMYKYSVSFILQTREDDDEMNHKNMR